MKRIFKMEGGKSKIYAKNAIDGCPDDGSIQIVIEPYKKPRTGRQNRYQWAGVLGDIANQAFVDGRQFSVEVWHEFFKKTLLPEQFDAELTLKGYEKWAELPDGSLRMIGSTTKLTTKGFSEYMEQIFAYGTQELSVKFSAK